MKVWILVETGEIRKAKQGEWFRHSNDPRLMEIGLAGENGTNNEYPVVIRKEIEIPDGSSWLSIYPYKIVINDDVAPYVIPIKKKVKRYRWVTSFGYMPGFFTEDEIRSGYPGSKFYHKIDETEKED